MNKLKKKFLTVFISYLFVVSNSFGIFHKNTQWDMRPTATAGNINGGSFCADYGGTDYSQQDSPQYIIGGITSGGAGNVLLSTSAANDWLGNGVFFIGGAQMNLSSPWWQITAVTPGVDFTVNMSTTYNLNAATGVVVDGVARIGGALSGNSIPTSNWAEDAIFEALAASNTLWIKAGGVYSWNTISVINSNCNSSTPCYITGYNNTRGDDPTPFGVSTTAPTINFNAGSLTSGIHMHYRNLKIIGSANGIITSNTLNSFKNIKIHNNASTPNRIAMSNSNVSGLVFDNFEIICQGGAGLIPGLGNYLNNGYIHNSSTGLVLNVNTFFYANNTVFSDNKNGNVFINATGQTHKYFFNNCTFLGYDNGISTAVINLSTGHALFNNSIFANGYAAFENRGMPLKTNQNFKNSYYNFIDTFTGFAYDDSFDTATAWGVNPQFGDNSLIYGTTATISGTQLFMHGGGMFDAAGITDNLDFVTTLGGTGLSSTNQASFLIIGHSSHSITCNQTLGTNSTPDKTFSIRIGKKFNIGTNLKALASYSVSGSSSTSYLDLGAVQRQEQGTSQATTAIGVIGN